MKIIPYNFTKITWMCAVVFSCLFAGASMFGDMSPKPSETVGGLRLVIENNTRFEILISDIVFTSNEIGGERNIPAKKISPYTSANIEPGSVCPHRLKSDPNWWPCYWGNKQFRGRYFTISSPQFEDTNAQYTIDIAKTKSGALEIQSLKTQREKGNCWYSVIKWNAVWKTDHYEITLTDESRDTGIDDGNYKCPDKKTS